MYIRDVKKVCIVGGGKMGRQIALNCALYGYETNLTDNENVLLDVATWAKDYLSLRIEKGKLSQEKAAETLNKFHLIPEIEDAVAEVQIVIEAIVEDKEAKKNFFRGLNKIVAENTIIASNSSYMVSSEFKDCVSNPSRLANAHYFNPALALKLVEVIKGDHTSEDTIEVLMDFAKATGKTPIRVNKEIDGFVVNRILRAIRDEAFYLLENNVVSPEDLDIGVELGLNHPMGPFKLLDFTGIDLMYLSSEKRWQDTGIKPNGFDIIKEMYINNEWGRKTGKGFYEYDK